MLNRIRTAFKRTVLCLVLGLAAVPAVAGPRYALRVDGLACPFCAYGIEKQLSQIEGVKSVTTDIGKGEVFVEMADGRVLDPTTAERAVKKAGFKLRGLEPAKSR